jgi:MarR family transcriptional regulator, transcriptional regulator for hemolysin
MSELYDTNESVGFLLSATHRALHRNLTCRLAESRYGVTPEQWWILLAIARQPNQNLSQSRIAADQRKDRAGIKRLVDSLEEKKLVTRRASPEDARANIVELTPQGFAALEDLSGIARSVSLEAVKEFAPKEVETLKRLLRRLLESNS